jgi:HK97 family phage prohead protease
MKQTIVGIAASRDGFASRETLEQRGARPELSHEFWMSPVSEFRKRQPATIVVDRDHDHDPCGRVLHVERNHENLWLVAETEGVAEAVGVRVGDELRHVSVPLYWSLESARREDFTDIEIRFASLTAATARLSPTPVKIFDGAIWQRSGWNLTSWERELLDRAAETHRKRRYGEPLVIYDPIPKLSHTGLAFASRASRPMEYRSAELAGVAPAEREIELGVAPAESPTEIYDRDGHYIEVFSYGAFAGAEQHPERIRVNRDHDLQRTIGVAVELDPWDDEGLVGTVRLARTPLADESLELARAGCLDASAGFRIVADEWQQGRSLRRVKKARLYHVGLTPQPAYEGARVTAVRGGTALR